MWSFAVLNDIFLFFISLWRKYSLLSFLTTKMSWVQSSNGARTFSVEFPCSPCVSVFHSFRNMLVRLAHSDSGLAIRLSYVTFGTVDEKWSTLSLIVIIVINWISFDVLVLTSIVCEPTLYNPNVHLCITCIDSFIGIYNFYCYFYSLLSCKRIIWM